MSRSGDDEREIELQTRDAPAEVASSNTAHPEVADDGNSVKVEPPTPTEAPRKANEFRGRQIQMMAISLSPLCLCPNVSSRNWFGSAFRHRGNSLP
jgi:hypothetical protein